MNLPDFTVLTRKMVTADAVIVTFFVVRSTNTDKTAETAFSARLTRLTQEAPVIPSTASVSIWEILAATALKWAFNAVVFPAGFTFVIAKRLSNHGKAKAKHQKRISVVPLDLPPVGSPI